MGETSDAPQNVALSLFGLVQSKTSVNDGNTSKVSTFNPEPVISHCFQRLKQEDFCLPQSRRRVFIVPGKEDPIPIDPTSLHRAPPQPIPSFKAPEPADLQEPPEDKNTWLSRRMKLRKDLESFGDVKRWLENKPTFTPSEAKVLQTINQERNSQLVTHFATKTIRKRSSRPSHRTVPQLRLPKPPVLWDMYAHLRSRKIKILEMFGKVDRGENQRISREEFILTLKAVGVPLKNQELEDIVIYLGSLGKHNSITMGTLDSTYKQWSLAQQKSTLPTARECYILAKRRESPRSPIKKQADLSPQPPQMDLLTVPEVDVQTEARPLTLEEMEDVGKRYREKRRQHQLPVRSIQYAERCRLVRCGNQRFDEHCLPSTSGTDVEELIDKSRMDAFLTYLQCWRLCEALGLPLTEDILTKALLYPGDKIIFQKDQVRPIRQPGGYYSDWKHFTLSRSQTLGWSPDRGAPVAKKSNKKVTRKIKKMHFKEFEDFVRKIKAKRPSGPQLTHPNFFWPGHLLDKLRLYLPTVATDRSLALFSCVRRQPHAYPATYHPDRWWPLRSAKYMALAHYDATKVYHIS